MPVVVYQFGDFSLDCGNFKLCRRGHRLKLERKPLELLVLLVTKHGQIVTRDEIAGCLWEREVFVDVEHGINTAIRKIRQTLGDSSDLPRFVQTISGSGYRFVAPVVSVAPEVTDPAQPLVVPVVLPSPPPQTEEPAAEPTAEAAPGNLWSRYIGRTGSAQWWTRVSIGVLAIVAGVAISFWFAGRRVQAVAPVRSLAVLPLQNLSGNPREQYFADGMTDALITELARSPSLRVVSRTSAMQEAGKKEPLRQIASELGVDAVVEGAIVRSGDRVRITAQLIDARNDRNLWAQSFEEPMTDVLTLQDEVVRQIALHTQTVLAPSPGVRRQQINPAAYDDYLRGLYWLHQREIAKSVAYLRQSVALDSSNAAAYAGLAEALTTSGVAQGSSRPAVQSEALAAAQRAIQLDPASGEAYTALGFININYGKDWASAGRDLEKGLALSPSNSLGEMQYAIYLDAMGRPGAAVAHMRRGLQLDPRSFIMNRHLGAVLYFDRRYNEALYYLRRAIQIEPASRDFAQSWITHCYEMMHQYDKAEQSDLTALGPWISAEKLAHLRAAYQRGGWKAYQAERIQLIVRQPGSGCDLFDVGESYLQLGDRDRAFSWLGRGVEAGCFWEDSLPVDPLFDSVRSDPRFSDLLGGVHLENTPG